MLALPSHLLWTSADAVCRVNGKVSRLIDITLFLHSSWHCRKMLSHSALQGGAFRSRCSGCAEYGPLQPHRTHTPPFQKARLLQLKGSRAAGRKASSSEENDLMTMDIPEPEDARGAIAVSNLNGVLWLLASFMVVLLHHLSRPVNLVGGPGAVQCTII